MTLVSAMAAFILMYEYEMRGDLQEKKDILTKQMASKVINGAVLVEGRAELAKKNISSIVGALSAGKNEKVRDSVKLMVKLFMNQENE